MIRRLIWALVRVVYVNIIKPIMFLAQPDGVHDRMVRVFSFIGRFACFRRLIRAVFQRPVNDKLRQTYRGIEFTNPVGLSAGLDKNGEIMPVIAALGFGFGVVGSVTAKRCAGNPKPWFYRLPKSQSLVVNAGLANQGSKAVIRRVSAYAPSMIEHFPVILSVAKTNSRQVVSVQDGIDDYMATVRRAVDAPNIRAIELNISCPNTYGGEPFTNARDLELLLAATDEIHSSKPLFVKMPNDLPWAKFERLLDVIIRHKVSGVTIANLAKDRSRIALKEDLPNTVSGNLSGKPTQDNSNELIRQTYLAYGDKLIIVGVGGIFSAEDAYLKIQLGASLVGLITGMIFRGPQLAAEINDRIAGLLEHDGYTHISQAIGVKAATHGR